MSTTELVVQVVGIVVSTGGVVAALAIAVTGNRAADRRAEEDRAEARRAARHRDEVDMLTRLTLNLERGGSSDPDERARMGVEATTLLMALGPERLPVAYALHVGDSPDDVRGFISDPSVPAWRQAANEVLMELQRVIVEERAASAGQLPPRALQGPRPGAGTSTADHERGAGDRAGQQHQRGDADHQQQPGEDQRSTPEQ